MEAADLRHGRIGHVDDDVRRRDRDARQRVTFGFFLAAQARQFDRVADGAADDPAEAASAGAVAARARQRRTSEATGFEQCQRFRRVEADAERFDADAVGWIGFGHAAGKGRRAGNNAKRQG